jgi:hypothetical protein
LYPKLRAIGLCYSTQLTQCIIELVFLFEEKSVFE